MLELTRGPSTESTLDPLAEAGELLGCGGRQGTGAKPTGGAVDGGQPLDRQPALPGGRQRDGGSKFGLGPLVRHAEIAEAVKGVGELPGGAGGVAIGQGHLTQGMAEPGHCLGGAERCRGLGEELRRAGDIGLEALAREEGRGPAKRRDRVVTLLPFGDATDEVAGTLQRIVDATPQGVGANEPVGGS